MPEIKQFKLTSNEEIICDVVEWPDIDEDEADMVVRNVFKIVAVTPMDQPVGGNRYYSFQPWMLFQDDSDSIQLLNSAHIVGEANPSDRLLEQYFIAMRGEATEHSEAARAEVQERLENYINGLRKMVEARLLPEDSDGGSKVIQFPGRVIH